MSTLAGFMSFCPDLIVEATLVCDRSCAGCYAPNVISRTGARELQKSNPSLFLSPERLGSALGQLQSGPVVASFRGGEPSRNPFLAELLQVARQGNHQLFVETHGRWIIAPVSGEEVENAYLIETLRITKATVKISFDRMHGLSTNELREITSTLDREGVQWCIAITEPSESEFIENRQLCPWVPDSKIIFQPKAASQVSLIRPRLGVIHANGSLSGQLLVKQSFFSESQINPLSRKPA